jgi:hypothetical protein
MMMKYAVKDDSVTLTGEAVPVERDVVYRTEDGKVVGNESGIVTPPPPKEKPNVDKKEMVDKIIANNKSGWDESDRGHLEGKSDDRLKQILDGLNKPTNNSDTATKPIETQAKKDDPVPITKNMTKEDAIRLLGGRDGILELLGPNFVAVHNRGQKMLTEAKDGLIKQITANSRNKFTKEFLAEKDLDELEAIAALAPPEDDDPDYDQYTRNKQRFIPSYYGNAVPPEFVANEEEPLLLHADRESRAAATK